MVQAVRQGESQRAVARRFRVSLSTVQWWVAHAAQARLDRVDWSDRSRRPHRVHRTPRAVEDRVLAVRRALRETSVLGEYGAPVIAQALAGDPRAGTLSVRTIGRILQRRGALDARGRRRHPPPPIGWYLPDVAAQDAELDSFDIITDLKLAQGPRLDVVTGMSLHGGLAAAWPMRGVSARAVVPALVAHWAQVGLPVYAQFDNDTIFQGPHQHRDVIGRVMRLCLSVAVVPVFVPPREPGFQAAIESFNGLWQQKVWARYHFATLRAVQLRSAHYIRRHREHASRRVEAAPPRRPLPPTMPDALAAPTAGRLIFLRRTNARGAMALLGHTFLVDHHWPHRLVRAEVDLGADAIRVHALRRRAPHEQPLLTEIPYHWPRRALRE